MVLPWFYPGFTRKIPEFLGGSPGFSTVCHPNPAVFTEATADAHRSCFGHRAGHEQLRPGQRPIEGDRLQRIAKLADPIAAVFHCHGDLTSIIFVVFCADLSSMFMVF